MKRKYNANELITNIIKSIEDIKGEEIILLDMKKIDNSPCDYFIICEGSSNKMTWTLRGYHHNINRIRH